jgi:hypothetical protein
MIIYPQIAAVSKEATEPIPETSQPGQPKLRTGLVPEHKEAEAEPKGR